MRLPTILNLQGPVVIFGSGNVALRKVKFVSKFTKDIIVVGRCRNSITENVIVKQCTLDAENFKNYVPKKTALVITALSDVFLNRKIAIWCKANGLLVNVVDDPESSSVIFPALSKEGDLSITVSTAGGCPFLARMIREELDGMITEKARWLEVLAPIRVELKGNEEKLTILSKIYADAEILNSIRAGEMELAKKKARGMYAVFRKH